MNRYTETTPIVPNGRQDLEIKENGKKWNRNTSYDPKYCEELIEKMSYGLSYKEAAREMGINFNTLNNWRKAFPEFQEAWDEASHLAQAWHETLARQHYVITQEPGEAKVTFNTTAFVYTMKSRFKLFDTAPPITVNVTNDEAKKQLDEVMSKYTDDLHKSTI